MPLQGSLRQLRLGDVLQTVLQAGQSGSFHVRSGGRRAVVNVGEQGLRLLEPDVLDERFGVEILVQRGVVRREIVDRVRSENVGDSGLVAALITRGGLDKRAWRSLLAEVVEDCVLDVLAWTDGDFRFEDAPLDEESLSPSARVLLEPSSLLLRAAQRQDERRQIADRIGPAAMLAVAREDAPAERVEALEGAERRLLARLDGRTLLKDAALAEGLTLFACHKTVASLVEAGLARLPTSAELAERVQERTEAQDVPAALALLRQWQSQSPAEIDAFERAVEIAAGGGRTEDEQDARRAHAEACLDAGRPEEARKGWEHLLRQRPGDPGALEGIRASARALGDTHRFASASRELAAAALEAGDGARAVVILQDLLALQTGDVAARVLLAKSLVRAGDRDKAVLELDRLAEALPTPCRRRQDRDAAAFCRDAALHLAPDRTDLLRKFREMVEGRRRRPQAVLILGGLLLALSATGVVLWPRPAARLLAEAKEAAGRGDAKSALALIARIRDEHPGTDEDAQAAALGLSVAPPRAPAAEVDPALLAQAKAALEAARAGLERWPEPGSVEPVDAFVAALRALPQNVPFRRVAAEALREPFAGAVSALRRAALERRDSLNTAHYLAERPPADVDAFRQALERAASAGDASWVARAKQAAATARKLSTTLPETAASEDVATDLRSLEGDVEGVSRTVNGRAPDLAAARREFHRALLLDAYEKARSEAVKALVRGDLDGAEAYYGRLEALLAQVDADPSLRPLRDFLQKRGIADFARARMDTLRGLRRGLRAAEVAEEAGNLEGACAAYARLAEQHPSIRFNDLFSVPLRVVPTPAASVVALNGKTFPPSPDGSVVVRYGWGTAATLTVSSEGFEPASAVLQTSASKPVSEMRVGLVPHLRWSAAPPATIEAPLVAVAGDVVLCTRSGRVRRHDGRSGTPLWTADLRSIEGVRGRPVLAGDVLWVPVLEGRLVRIDATHGVVQGEVALRSRPVGDAAVAGGRVAVAVDDAVAIVPADGPTAYVGRPATTTAGVLAAHGAFWVGDAAGGLTRVDPASGETRTGTVAAGSPVVGLAEGDGGVLALSADGTLLAVDGAGTVRWRRPGLGDVLGPPAEAGGEVFVAERGGHVRVLDAATGNVKLDHDLRAAAVGGLVSSRGRVAAALADGRVWVHAPGVGTLVDGLLGGTIRVAPAVLGDGAIAVPSAGATIGVFALPP